MGEVMGLSMLVPPVTTPFHFLPSSFSTQTLSFFPHSDPPVTLPLQPTYWPWWWEAFPLSVHVTDGFIVHVVAVALLMVEPTHVLPVENLV